MTKINFKRAGGITGREVETELDLNELPADEAQELMQLLTASNFFTIPQNLIAPAVTPDEYEYTIAVDANSRYRCMGACLLSQVSEPPRRICNQLVERCELGCGCRAI